MNQNHNNGKQPWLKSQFEDKVSAEEPVSGGRPTQKLNIFARFNNWFPHVLYFVMIAWAYFVLALYAMIMLFMLNHIGLMIWYITVAIFVYQRFLKRYRRRLTFLRRLKSKCRNNKYRYKAERGFFKTFRYARRGVDFRLDAGDTVYFVRFLSVKRKNSSLMLWDKDTAQIVYPRQRSWVNVRFDKPCTKTVRAAVTKGFGVMQIKQMALDFDERFSVLGSKTARKILLIEPEPRIIYKKLPEGGVTVTGTGEIIGDFTILTGDDFLSNILGGKK